MVNILRNSQVSAEKCNPDVIFNQLANTSKNYKKTQVPDFCSWRVVNAVKQSQK